MSSTGGTPLRRRLSSTGVVLHRATGTIGGLAADET